MFTQKIGDSPLLNGMRSKYRSLIPNVQTFKEKIVLGNSFHYVEAIPEIGVSKVRTCTLDAIAKFWGPVPFQNSDLYRLKDGHRGFLEDLLNYNGSACFTDIYEANMYRNELISNWEELVIPVNSSQPA